MPESDERLIKSLGSMDIQTARMESLISDLLWLSRMGSVEGVRKMTSLTWSTCLLISVTR